MDLMHASCVRYGDAGLIIRGPSGSGKSDLALRLIADGGRLVADDYVWVGAEAGTLYAVAPDTIAGQMEVRGIGIVASPALRVTPIDCVLELVGRAAIDRLPPPRLVEIGGLFLPSFDLDPFQASAVAKVAAAIGLCRDGSWRRGESGGRATGEGDGSED